MRVALVAGATRGAGRAIAVELARAGFFVYATGRSSRASGASEIGRPETIEETGDMIGAAGAAGAVRVVDHEDPGQVTALVAGIEGEHGRLDVLVNDIFGGDRYMEWDKPLWEHDWAGGLRMLQMGVHTHLVTSWAAIPLMLRTAPAHNTRGLVVEMTDGTSPANAEFRRNVGLRCLSGGCEHRQARNAAVLQISEVARLAEPLEGVRYTTADGLAQWRYHGRLVARQLDDTHMVIRADFDYRASVLRQFPETFSVPTRYSKHMMVVADLARGDAGAIEDALEAAWQLQRTAG